MHARAINMNERSAANQPGLGKIMKMGYLCEKLPFSPS